MDMQTEHIDDLIAGYALGALDETERARCEQHTAVCPPCRQEANATHEIAQMLAFTAAAVPPPISCKRKLLSKIEREQFLAAPTRRPRTQPSIATWMAFASFALLMMTGGWGMSLQRQLTQTRASLASLSAEAQTMRTQIAESPRIEAAFRNTETIRVLQPQGKIVSCGAKTYMKTGENDAMLVVWGLPRLEEGKVYKIWVAREDQQQPLTAFAEAESTHMISISPPEPMDRYQNIMITVEDDPAVTQPSEETVLLGDL